MSSAAPPLISVLLPVWNAISTLPACLHSLQRQSETDWECIIVDDGSHDGSLAQAKAFAHLDPRFIVIPTVHRGLVKALNTGLYHCQGRLIARMDADDLMHRQRLSMQRQMLDTQPNLAAVGCHVRIFPRIHLREGRKAYERWLNSIDGVQRVCEDAFIECPVAHPTLMIRKPILAGLGYRDCNWPEDYDLVLRLLSQQHLLSVVPQRLLSWRDTATRLSRIHPAYGLERFTACKAAFLATTFLASQPHYILWGYGETGKALRRALSAHNKHPVYIVEIHPRRLGKTIHSAPVIPPESLTHIPRHPVIISVAGVSAREEIRAAMTQMGFVECQDFVCAA